MTTLPDRRRRIGTRVVWRLRSSTHPELVSEFRDPPHRLPRIEALKDRQATLQRLRKARLRQRRNRWQHFPLDDPVSHLKQLRHRPRLPRQPV